MRALILLAAAVALSGCRTVSLSAEGRVVSESGSPVAGALVTAGPALSPGGRVDSLTSTRTDAEGAFTLGPRAVRCALLRCPDLWIRIESPGYEVRRLPATEAAPDALAVIRLVPPRGR